MAHSSYSPAVTTTPSSADVTESFDPAVPTDPDGATATQRDLSAEIGAIIDDYRRSGIEELQPRWDYAPYRSSILRHPTKDLRHADPEDDRAVLTVLRPP